MIVAAIFRESKLIYQGVVDLVFGSASPPRDVRQAFRHDPLALQFNSSLTPLPDK